MNSTDSSRTASSTRPPRVKKRDGAAHGREAADALAAGALGFIAADPQELSRFLALTGIDPAAIRAAAAEPGFLGGVLAYIAGNERTLLAFAEHAGVAPQEVERALTALTSVREAP